MRRRAILKFLPRLERFEAKHLLSSGSSAIHPALLRAASEASILPSATPLPTLVTRYHVSRITNPTPTNAQLIPPFAQVMVQPSTVVPGTVYNVFFVSMRNSTAQTFDANSGFTVGISGGARAYPILTGNELWKPGQVMVFYVLTKKFYPVSPAVSAGFVFNLDGSAGVAIPGPSGVYLRVKYNPATFPWALDWIVAFGPGAKGHELGLPDTAIWEFTAIKTLVRSR